MYEQMLDNYKILSKLTYQLANNVESYFVQKRSCKEINYNIHKIPVTNKNDHLLLKVKERKEKKHPNLINFIDYFYDETRKYLYVVTENMSKGNLNMFITTCRKCKCFLHEEFICKILQQVLFSVKTVENLNGLNFDEMFFDDDYTIKFLDLNFTNNQNKLKTMKTKYIAELIKNLCLLETETVDQADIECYQLYSNDFRTFLNSLLKDRALVHKNIDKLLCNSVLMLKGSQWTKDKSFLTIVETDQNGDQNYSQKLRALKLKQTELEKRELSLNEREKSLNIRESIIAQLEEKYKHQMDGLQPLDESLIVDCGDSVINAKTAQKLDLDKLQKPAMFLRSKSERRIKFKGHSPLKEINFNHQKRKSVRHSVHFKKLETVQQSSDGSLEGGSSGNSRRHSKALFTTGEENDPNGGVWNEENKKYAFDLLRIMNGNKNGCNIRTKHTLL